MAQDPATLWYWNDWIGGTVTLTRFQKGCYMDLLGAQFNSGPLSIEEIHAVLGSDFETAWPILKKKFEIDANGLLFNIKALETKNKRAAYPASRRVNSREDMGDHMENVIENIKLEFLNKVENYKGDFSENLIQDFLGYWLEKNKSGTKFRFQDQKFFDMKKRLQTFERNDKSGKYSKSENAISRFEKANQDLKNSENKLNALFGGNS